MWSTSPNDTAGEPCLLKGMSYYLNIDSTFAVDIRTLDYYVVSDSNPYEDLPPPPTPVNGYWKFEVVSGRLGSARARKNNLTLKGAVSLNSAKLGNYQMPVKLRET